MTQSEHRTTQQLLQRWRMLVEHLWQRLGQDNVPGVAASLSYTSLLALVPLVSISVAVLSAFPVFDSARTELQRLVFDTFVPASGEVIEESITNFVQATGRLTAIGVAGLAVTSVMLLVTIEKAFNGIFRATEGRSLAARLVLYWTVLTLGPLLMGTAFALSGYITAIGGAGALWARSAMGEWAFSWAQTLWNMGSLALPHLLTMCAFGVLYRLVPNRPVKTRDAVVGAVLAGIVFASLRFGFLTFFARGGAYHTVYGAMAALPLFLVWMYVSWIVVLGGAVITSTLPEWRILLRQGHAEPVNRLWLALYILDRLATTRPKGLRRAKLAQIGIPGPLIDDVLGRLAQANMVLCGEGDRWVILGALDDLTIAQVGQAIGDSGLIDPLPVQGSAWGAGWTAHLGGILDGARTARDSCLSVTVADALSSPLNLSSPLKGGGGGGVAAKP